MNHTTSFVQRGAAVAGMKPKKLLVWKKTNGRCGYCGKVLIPTEFDIDHMIPKASGGSHDASNLMASCINCNRAKAGKSVEQFRLWVTYREMAQQRKLSIAHLEWLKEEGVIQALSGVSRLVIFFFETSMATEVKA